MNLNFGDLKRLNIFSNEQYPTMHQRGHIQRYLWMIQYIKNNDYPTQEAILNEIGRQYDLYQYESDRYGLSNSTFKRDLRDIREGFGLSIQYSSKEKGYYIPNDESQLSIIEEYLGALDLYNAMGLGNRIPRYIMPETRRPNGLQHMPAIIKAIEKCSYVTFLYQKFDKDELTERTFAPYALKESRNRWYVLGFEDGKPDQPKSFGLDRMSQLAMTGKKFIPDTAFDWEENYRYSFGAYTNEAPQKVVLSFDQRDGNYLTAMPLHPTQTATRKGDRVILELTIKITLDFMMELMSRCWSVEVIEPVSLRKKLEECFISGAKRNSIN